jgi:uncharacterized protein (TIGR04255 family)
MGEPIIYPNAPLALAAVEVRHPESDEPLTSEQLKVLSKRLTPNWPIKKPGQDISIQVVNGVPGPQVVEKYMRFFSRDYTSSVAVKDAAISLETTKYPGWKDFQALIKIILEARHEASPLIGCERIGLRYLDEIRVPGEAPIDWKPWIDASLLGPVLKDPIGLTLNEWQALFVYGPSNGHSVVLRYGPREGYAVDPSAALKRINAPKPGGHFFLLDFDSFWQPTDELPEFHPDEIVERCDYLHAPMRTLFDGLTTDKLRKEVFEHAPDGSS